MAKKKENDGLIIPKHVEVNQKTIEAKVKNEDFGGYAVNAIAEKAIEKGRELAYNTTVKAMSAMDALKLQYENLTKKADLGKNTPVQGKPGEFTRESFFSDEKAAKITNTVKHYNLISEKFDIAMSKTEEGEGPWTELAKVVGEASKVLSNANGK